MTNNDLKYWLAISRITNIGAVRMGKLFRAFQNMERAFCASREELQCAELEPNVIETILRERSHIDPDQELERIEKEHVTVLTLADETYPSLLKQIFDPPALLFIRGTLPDQTRKHIAIVGTRHPTRYGLMATDLIIEPLALSGAVIVSGLAYGIDAAAHKATLKHNGTTLAVLGSGVDQASIYPTGNRTLAIQIIEHGGAIISEFPLGTEPFKSHFPLRNRVIAGLCHATVVIEAAQKSGSLITARAALEDGREVYAVPGPIDSLLSEGPNNLLKMGAAPVTVAADIMEVKETRPTTFSYEPRNETERQLLAHVSHEPIHVDELMMQANLAIEILNSALTLLEIKGVIRHVGGRYYIRVS